MGYYTNYKVKIIKGQLPEYERKIIDDGFTTFEKLIVTKACAEYGDPFREANKWYDHEVDMVRFSKLYPDVLLELSGEGEENGDVWKKYYKAGKSCEIRPEVIWPHFDESMLN